MEKGGKRKADSDPRRETREQEKVHLHFHHDLKRRNAVRSCVHEVAIPPGYFSANDESIYGTLGSPEYRGPMAKNYPFSLDPFQRVSVACLERKESVLVSAHTSAGKTAVAEYAIAMAFRDKQRVIYTSPLKALSNQKYRDLVLEFKDVGLMTGDVSLSPNASCLVMTTEILRGMLYRGAEVLKEVAWVIFDEIHYMKDRERGVVWEESIIFMPPAIKMAFLSATMSNATEFAEWICKLHGQPCHVVCTDFRPTPLQHYAFPAGGSGIYLVVDEQEQFRELNFAKMRERGGSIPRRNAAGRGNSRRGGNQTDVFKIVKMIMERNFQPAIVFSFGRRDCEQHALSIAKLDFNTDEEKQAVEEIFQNGVLCLNEEDRGLPVIERMLPLLQRGIGFHHSGLLPVLKELVEILFQEGLIKALFATETFAMGLNMPAKTVVFTALRKFDGDGHRWMSSGEYIQMSGRAGRRGKDEFGICIAMIDDQMDMNTCREMITGKPAALASTFRLSYYTLLNLMSRSEGQIDAEHVIRNSFLQFQQEKTLPEVELKIARLEKEAARLDASEETELADYHNLKLAVWHLEKQMMQKIITRPERVLRFLVPGRLVRVAEGATDWGWGAVVNLILKKPVGHVADILLHCTPSDHRPAAPGEKGEMLVVPVQLRVICAIGALRVGVPSDLRPAESRRRVLAAVQELQRRFSNSLPRLDPVQDMGIDDPEIVQLARKIREAERKLNGHPLSTSEQNPRQRRSFQTKAELVSEAQRLRTEMRDCPLHKFREELRNRCRVLKRLGHIDDHGVVQLKGRAARLIDTADELLATELMFDGTFAKLDPHLIAALASCFIPGDKSREEVKLGRELALPLRQLKESAARIAEVQRRCKLEVDVEEYVESKVRPYLMDVVYGWSQGKPFSEIIAMSDIFEGSIVRIIRRLDEFLNQLKAAAHAVGDLELEKKFEGSSESLRRGIIFANSLYL